MHVRTCCRPGKDIYRFWCCGPPGGELTNPGGQAGVERDSLVGVIEDKVREACATIIVEESCSGRCGCSGCSCSDWCRYNFCTQQFSGIDLCVDPESVAIGRELDLFCGEPSWSAGGALYCRLAQLHLVVVVD